jgi:hypothetical protein
LLDSTVSLETGIVFSLCVFKIQLITVFDTCTRKLNTEINKSKNHHHHCRRRRRRRGRKQENALFIAIDA